MPVTGVRLEMPIRPPTALVGTKAAISAASAGATVGPGASPANLTCCQNKMLSSLGVLEFHTPSMVPLALTPEVVVKTVANVPAMRATTCGSSPGKALNLS